jgi:hypothetical protein
MAGLIKRLGRILGAACLGCLFLATPAFSKAETTAGRDDSSKSSCDQVIDWDEKWTQSTINPVNSSERTRLLMERANRIQLQLDCDLKKFFIQSLVYEEDIGLIRVEISKLASEIILLNEFIQSGVPAQSSSILLLEQRIANAEKGLAKLLQASTCSMPECANLDSPDLVKNIGELATAISALTGGGSGEPGTAAYPESVTVVVEHAAVQERDTKPVTQLLPDSDLTRLYEGAKFTYVFVSLPDPRIPRHRRVFESSLNAISSGLNDRQYTLDRYYFPWEDYETGEGDSSAPGRNSRNTSRPDELATCHSIPAQHKSFESISSLEHGQNQNCFGLIVYRKDLWRQAADQKCPGKRCTAILVVYVLPETTTYGALRGAVFGAMDHLERLASSVQFGMRLQPYCIELSSSGCFGQPLTFVGPSFSGSVDSYVRAFGAHRKKKIQLSSKFVHEPHDYAQLFAGGVTFYPWSATSSSNDDHPDLGLDGKGQSKKASRQLAFEIKPLVTTDDRKVTAVKQVADRLNVQAKDVFFFVEQSTFGQTICNPDNQKENVCQSKNIFTFSANLAEIRALEHSRSVSSKAKPSLEFTESDSVINELDNVSENGSEYPSSQISLLGRVGTDLALEIQLAELKKRSPKIVVVAASEIRDRLFLLRHFRQMLPKALIIDFETDILSSHPEFIDFTRGTLQLGSVNPVTTINGRTTVSQTDYQSILGAFFSNFTLPNEQDSIEVLVVGRDGLYRHNQAHGDEESGRWIPLLLAFTTALVVLFLLLLHFGKFTSARTGAWARSATLRNTLADFHNFAICVLMFAGLAYLAYLLSVSLSQFPSVRTYPGNMMLALLTVAAGTFFLKACRNAPTSIFGFDLKLGSLTAKFPAGPAVIHERTLNLGIWSGLFGSLLLIIAASAMAGSCSTDIKCLQSAFVTSTSSASGLSWRPAYVSMVVLSIAAVFMLKSIKAQRSDHQRQWMRLMIRLSNSSVKEVHRYRSVAAKLLLFVLGAVLATALFRAVPLGVTAFGPVIDAGFFLGLLASSLVGMGSLTMSVRLFHLLDLHLSVLARASVRLGKDNNPGGLLVSHWEWTVPTGLDDFALTPIMARINWKKPVMLPSARDDMVLKGALGLGQSDLARVRYMVRDRVAREVWAIRWLLFLCMFSCLSGVMLIYYFPVPGRDGLLTLNMSVMVIAAVFFAYCCLRLERNAIASRLLSDRDERISWSFGMLNALTIPFVLVALTVLVSEVPGMREVTSDYVLPLLQLFGFRWN